MSLRDNGYTNPWQQLDAFSVNSEIINLYLFKRRLLSLHKLWRTEKITPVTATMLVHADKVLEFRLLAYKELFRAFMNPPYCLKKPIPARINDIPSVYTVFCSHASDWNRYYKQALLARRTLHYMNCFAACDLYGCFDQSEMYST